MLPAFVAVAVKVTLEPAHIVLEDAEMVADGAVVGLTTIGIPALVAVEGDAHPELEVITQLTTSLFASEELLNVLEFVPAFMLFTFH